MSKAKTPASALSPLREALLHSVLSQPSAPFRERHVLELLKHELEQGGVPHFIDPVGNLVLGASSKADYLKVLKTRSKEPLRLYIAHTDHPGFHGESWIGQAKGDTAQLAITWHGGSPIADIENAKVWLASRDGLAGEGRFVSAKLIPSGRALESGIVSVPAELRVRFPKATDLYGGFAFRAPVWQEGRVIYTKAADDLVGSFAIVSLALDLFKKGRKSSKRPPFLALLTRAEEVGFIGAIGHFELGWIKQAKRPVLCVSLETSRQLPGAEIGKGPVVRLGDKTGVFSSNYLRAFTDVANKQLAGRHQKRVMDGGTCEATAAIAYGLPAVGISVPLGNYHNMNFEGGPDSSSQSLGPAPEFVHMDDIQGLLELCHALLDTGIDWSNPWSAKLKEFRKELKDYGKLLKSGP